MSHNILSNKVSTSTERGMTGNYHISCGVGEKLEITSNAYLLLTFLKNHGVARGNPFSLFLIELTGQVSSIRNVFNSYGV